jgi:3',5'-cyclic AMP phosphodiesterase CpdA
MHKSGHFFFTSRYSVRLFRRLPVIFWIALVFTRPVRGEETKPFFFFHLADPQFGMYAKNANFEQEAINWDFAIATANRLKPAFVVVTGDLINEAGNQAQADAYLRSAARLDRSIRLYHLPGNHDVGNDPTPQSLATYRAKFGPDYFGFRHGKFLGLVLNSNSIRSSRKFLKESQQQEAWLKGELEKARKEQVRHVVVFQHHPPFLKNTEEPDGYENLPRAERGNFLNLFRRHGVKYLFAGHVHRNAIAHAGNLEIVASGAIGQPLGGSKSGLRVVVVRDRGLEHRFYEMGEIPNRIDLSSPENPGRGKK